MAYGSNGWTLQANFGGAVDLGQGLSVGGSVTGGLTRNNALNLQGRALRYNYGFGYKTFSYRRTHYRTGDKSQIVGNIGFRIEGMGSFIDGTSVSISNDVGWFGGNGDR